MGKHSRGRKDTSQTLDRLMGGSAVDGALAPSENNIDTSSSEGGRAEARQVPVGKATARSRGTQGLGPM